MNKDKINKQSIEEITKVPYYGKKFPFVPWTLKTKGRVSVIFIKRLYQKIGFLQFFKFWIQFPFLLSAVLKKNREGLTLMQSSFGWLAKMQWGLLITIYRFIEKLYTKEEAYSYVEGGIREGGQYMMAEFYQSERLATFEDPYLAFWEYHKAMFKDDPNFENEIIEEEGCNKMIVHNCQNCIIAKLTIPELSTIGCEHDIAGFEAIAEQIQMDFRRPTTLAKDGKPCEFMFFRKGTAPEGIETK